MGEESRGSHFQPIPKVSRKKKSAFLNRKRKSQAGHRLFQDFATRSPAQRCSCQPGRTVHCPMQESPPMSFMLASQNPRVSELGSAGVPGPPNTAEAVAEAAHDHSMAHKFSSQNWTERCSQFSLFRQHFGYFQCGQLRLRANMMNLLRIQR